MTNHSLKADAICFMKTGGEKPVISKGGKAMQCTNPNCKYHFFEQEEQYFVCPCCADIIEDNICYSSWDFEDIKQEAYYYSQRKNIIRIMKLILAFSPFVLHFLIQDILLREWKSMFIFTQNSQYTTNRFLLPLLIILFVYRFLNRENGLLITLLGDKAYYANSKIVTALKLPIYLLLMLSFFYIEVPIFKEFLLKNDKQYLSYTANQIHQGIDKLVGEHIFVTAYSFFVFYLMELLDMYQ